MTMVRVVGKGRTEPMAVTELDARRAGAARTVIDVGTGDAHYPYRLALAHPDWLVVGIDALDEPMGEIARKAGRKPAKGGVANLLLLRAAAESLPGELHDVADEVTVLLPWGRLLEGIVLAHDDVVRGLAELLRPAGRLAITLNGEIWVESLPVRYEHVPVPTPDHIAEVVAPAFARAGVDVGPASYLPADAALALPTTWARKLAHGRAHPRYVHFEGEKRT